MRIIHNTVTGMLAVMLAVAANSCLEDDSIFTGDDNSTTVEEEQPVDNSSIDIRAFDAIDLNRAGLESVKAFYEAGEYYRAGSALLDYYRTRTNVTNASVNLISPTISTTEQNYADRALSTNGYNLYVPDFYAESNSYAAGNADVIKWDMNPSGDTEELYQLNRLAWMAMQGKAYRVSLNETYVTDWATVYEAWLASHALPEGITDFNTAAESASDPAVKTALYGWRPYDVSFRLADKCNIMYYFMQSINFTPGLLTKLIANVAEEAAHVYANMDEDDNTRMAKEGYALYRAGYIFPEMKSSAQWLAKGNEYANMDVDTRVFDLLDMNYTGLSKVAAAYNAGDYGLALDELLAFYRSRTHGRNPSVDFDNTTATANEQKWAEMALRENGYRFYVNNYYDASAGTQVPYSYMNAGGNGIDWTLRHTGEQEQLYQLHRHQWMLPQAKTYHVTGDEKYVRNWMEVYGDWIENVPKPADDVNVTNHRSWRPLDVAARLIDRCALLEYYQTSPSITPEWIAEVLVRIDEETNHIIRNYSETTNHLITQAQAVTFAGMLFPELKNSGKWKDSGTGVLANEVSRQYFDDGWLMDGDFHYHISSIEDFRLGLVIAQLNKEDGRFPANYVESMRKMTHVVMNMIYPNYSVPNMTDTRSDTWSKSVLTRNLRNYANLFSDDAELKWMATEGAEGTMPEHCTYVMPDGGYYVLRSGWTMQDMMMVVDNMPDNNADKWHRQNDNGTFELWVKGRNFFPDSGCFSYGGTSSSNADRKKYAATSAHNTLTLDGKNSNQKGTFLKEVTRTGRVAYNGFVFENAAYSNLNHRRAIFLVNNKFYVIMDEATGSASGELALNFNVLPGSASEVFVDEDMAGFYTTFADNNNILARTFCDQSTDFNTRKGIYSTNIGKNVDREAYEVTCEKPSSQNVVRFVTVLIPTEDPASLDVSVSFGERTDKSASATVKIGKTEYDLSYQL